jgi:AraC-like DNA-binding protein
MTQQDIKDITAYIREHILEEFNIEDIADHFGYSKFHFSREFKKIMGVSAAEYLSSLRIEQSIKKLGKNDVSVLNAQLKTGYLSSGTFSNLFSRFTGLSPKQFQKEMDGLYGDLKGYEAKEAEGIIHYPPLLDVPSPPRSGHKCIVHIVAPDTFKGMIFVGIFDQPISNRRPILGEALVKSRTCVFDDSLKPGKYYLLVCAVEKQRNPLRYFMLDDCLRDIRREPIEFPLKETQEYVLTLRKLEPDDPPITINIPKLLKEGLEQRFFKNRNLR